MKRLVVSGDTEIPKVPQQLPLECDPLLAYRLMPITPAPVGHALERTPEAVLRGLLLHHPVPLAGLGPVVREAQQVERAGPGPSVAVAGGRLGPLVRSPEVNQSGLFRGKRQTVFGQPLWQHVEDPLRVLLPLEDDDYIIRIAD